MNLWNGFLGRRRFLQAGLGAAIGAGVGGSAQAQSPTTGSGAGTTTSGPRPVAGAPGAGFTPVVAPDLPKLPFKQDGGVKVFTLIAENVKQEVVPGKVFDLWGYNGSAPGPTV